MARHEHVLFSFLKALKVPFTKPFLEELVNGLPTSNTLLGISNILKERYHIDNVSLLIQKDDIYKLDAPYIVQLHLPTAPIIMVTAINAERIFFVHKSKPGSENINFFFENWSGAVLLAEPEHDSREKNYWQNRRSEVLRQLRVPAIMLALGIILIYLGLGNIQRLLQGGWNAVALQILYFSGLAISSTLFMHELNKESSLVERVCSAATKTGCSKVLSSKAAKFLGLISWSEIGFFYFLSCTLSLLLVNNSYNFLYLMSIAVLPYTIWSIYYQWQIARQWCPFCITIQIIFWCIYLTFSYHHPYFNQLFTFQSYIPSILCFCLTFLFLWLVIPFAKDHFKVQALNADLRSLKFHPAVLNSTLLLRENVDINDAGSIVFGNRESEIRLTIVTDIYCPHCIEAHEYIKDLLASYHDQILYQIIFSIPAFDDRLDHAFNKSVQDKHNIIRSLIRTYIYKGETTALQVFDHWFEKGRNDYKSFLADHEIPTDDMLITDEFEKQFLWQSKATLTGTPAIFINNRPLPKWYNAGDLKDLITTMLTATK